MSKSRVTSFFLFPLILGIVGLVIVWSLPGMASSESYSIDIEDKALVQLGKAVYLEHCASCHGVNLEGQPNWQIRDENDLLPAPPHDETGHTWHHPDKTLFDMVKLGPANIIEGYESTMPGYADILSDEEIRASLSYIASTWPEKVKARQKQMNDSYEKYKE